MTYLLIVANVVMFIMTLSDRGSLTPNSANFYEYGLIPVDIIQGKNLYTLVTSIFLHANLLHLGTNMLFLLITGDGCERAMGSARFLVFYMIFGVTAGLFYVYMNQTSADPAIGASGAIFGVLAAFTILFPFRWVITLFGFIPVPLPAIVFVFIAILTETALAASGALDFVAHHAHLGGFLAGVFLTLLFGPKRHKIQEKRK